MNKFKLTMAVAAALLVTVAAQAKTPTEFAQKAAIANKFEIVTSKLAEKKTQNADIKSFADQMIADHGKVGMDFKATLSKSGVKMSDVPKGLDKKHRDIYEKLAKESGDTFNQDYVKAQVDAHQEAVDLFSDYADNGKNDSLKAFAARNLPTLKMHQEHVTNLQAKM